MLSVLAMYPAAADMMGRAISNSQLAEGLVNARSMDDGVDWTSSAYSKFVNVPVKNTGALPGWYNQPAGETPAFLLVDQYAALSGVYRYNQLPIEIANLNSFKILPGPPSQTVAVDPSSGNPTQSEIAGRFFTCNSDVVLNKSGLANKDDETPQNSIPTEREGKFTVANFYSQPMPLTYQNYIRKHLLLFKDRSQTISANDLTYFDVPGAVLNPNPLPISELILTASPTVSLRARQWLLITDSTPNLPSAFPAYPVNLDFFEIQSVDETSAGFVKIEVRPNIIFNAKSVYLLKDVVRVALIGS